MGNVSDENAQLSRYGASGGAAYCVHVFIMRKRIRSVEQVSASDTSCAATTARPGTSLPADTNDQASAGGFRR
jgi:hypothetical protein